LDPSNSNLSVVFAVVLTDVHCGHNLPLLQEVFYGVT
jgi:hypothetical protein